MIACIQKLLERLGIIDHVEDTAWNAHGNTATGDASSEFRIDGGAFHIEGIVGDTPASLASQTGHFAWLPKKKALRIGIAPNPAVDGFEWTDAQIGSDSIGIGYQSHAPGGGGLALGYSTLASGSAQSVAIGASAQATTGVFSVSVGYQTLASANVAVAIGVGTQATAQNACCIGTGQGFGALPFVNNKSNSLMLGANINSAAGTLATVTLFAEKCGINNENPLSTLDIGGSVGYQYTPVSTADSPKTILTTDNEYVFICDVSSGSIIIELPLISGINGRIYHFKVVNISGAATPGSLTLNISSGSGDRLEDANGVPILSTDVFSAPDNVVLIADTNNSAWWTL